MAINVRLRNAALNVNLQTPSVNNVRINGNNGTSARLRNTAINVRLQGNDPTTTVRTVAISPPPTSANQFNEFDLLGAFDGCTLVYDEARQKFVVGTIAVVSGGSF